MLNIFINYGGSLPRNEFTKLCILYSIIDTLILVTVKAAESTSAVKTDMRVADCKVNQTPMSRVVREEVYGSSADDDKENRPVTAPGPKTDM